MSSRRQNNNGTSAGHRGMGEIFPINKPTRSDKAAIRGGTLLPYQ
jgi:hypothetical protein